MSSPARKFAPWKTPHVSSPTVPAFKANTPTPSHLSLSPSPPKPSFLETLAWDLLQEKKQRNEHTGGRGKHQDRSLLPHNNNGHLTADMHGPLKPCPPHKEFEDEGILASAVPAENEETRPSHPGNKTTISGIPAPPTPIQPSPAQLAQVEDFESHFNNKYGEGSLEKLLRERTKAPSQSVPFDLAKEEDVSHENTEGDETSEDGDDTEVEPNGEGFDRVTVLPQSREGNQIGDGDEIRGIGCRLANAQEPIVGPVLGRGTQGGSRIQDNCLTRHQGCELPHSINGVSQSDDELGGNVSGIEIQFADEAIPERSTETQKSAALTAQAQGPSGQSRSTVYKAAESFLQKVPEEATVVGHTTIGLCVAGSSTDLDNTKTAGMQAKVGTEGQIALADGVLVETVPQTGGSTNITVPFVFNLQKINCNSYDEALSLDRRGGPQEGNVNWGGG